MKIHNAIIYHCLKCGNVAHIEIEARAPHCCGHKMARAAMETIRETESVSGTAQRERAELLAHGAERLR